jgi:hypothetical protein
VLAPERPQDWPTRRAPQVGHIVTSTRLLMRTREVRSAAHVGQTPSTSGRPVAPHTTQNSPSTTVPPLAQHREDLGVGHPAELAGAPRVDEPALFG